MVSDQEHTPFNNSGLSSKDILLSLHRSVWDNARGTVTLLVTFSVGAFGAIAIVSHALMENAYVGISVIAAQFLSFFMMLVCVELGRTYRMMQWLSINIEEIGMTTEDKKLITGIIPDRMRQKKASLTEIYGMVFLFFGILTALFPAIFFLYLYQTNFVSLDTARHYFWGLEFISSLLIIGAWCNLRHRMTALKEMFNNYGGATSGIEVPSHGCCLFIASTLLAVFVIVVSVLPDRFTLLVSKTNTCTTLNVKCHDKRLFTCFEFSDTSTGNGR